MVATSCDLNAPRCTNKFPAGTSMSVLIDITDDTLASLLVPVQCASLAPPALISTSPGAKFNDSSEVTHTHTRMQGKDLKNCLCKSWEAS